MSGRLSLDSRTLLEHFGAHDGTLPCPLPGHDGQASLEVPADDPHAELRLRCCAGRWRSLGELRAAIAYGTDAWRSNIELAIWTRRLAFDAQLILPVRVELPEMEADAPACAHRARAGFALLLGLRLIDYEPRPVPFAVRFVAAWCGLPFQGAAEGLRELKKRKVIKEVRRDGRLPLYLPGPTVIESDPW